MMDKTYPLCCASGRRGEDCSHKRPIDSYGVTPMGPQVTTEYHRQAEKINGALDDLEGCECTWNGCMACVPRSAFLEEELVESPSLFARVLRERDSV